METEQLVSLVAAMDEDATSDRAPARLKAQIYSALVGRLAQLGPLRPLSECKEAGGHLCVFEQAVATLTPEHVASANPCRVCHARVLGERLEWAPIYWPGCPYSEFHNP